LMGDSLCSDLDMVGTLSDLCELQRDISVPEMIVPCIYPFQKSC
jgi:hypothetical protein